MSDYTERLGRLTLYQRDGQFKLSLDAVLLAEFASVGRGEKICELGCGAGALMLLLLSAHPDVFIDGIEIQREAALMAEKAVRENGLSDRARVFEGDFRENRAEIVPGSYGLVVANPPYFRAGTGKIPENGAISRAKTEIDCTMKDVCSRAVYLLRAGGLLGVVYPPERLPELICTLRETGLEPKRLRLAHHGAGTRASLVLVEARKGGRPGLTVEPPVFTGKR